MLPLRHSLPQAVALACNVLAPFEASERRNNSAGNPLETTAAGSGPQVPELRLAQKDTDQLIEKTASQKIDLAA